MSRKNILELDDFNWEKVIEKGKKPAIVMFSSPTCPFCRQMEPFFEESLEHGAECVDKTTWIETTDIGYA